MTEEVCCGLFFASFDRTICGQHKSNTAFLSVHTFIELWNFNAKIQEVILTGHIHSNL